MTGSDMTVILLKRESRPGGGLRCMKVKAAATLPGARPSTLRGGPSISWSGGAVNRLDASVRAVAIERFVPGAVSGRGVWFVEQVVLGKSDGFQLGVGFVEPESCHALACSAVRAGAVGDGTLLGDPPICKPRVFVDQAKQLAPALE